MDKVKWLMNEPNKITNNYIYLVPKDPISSDKKVGK
jgi:hypothetical protein